MRTADSVKRTRGQGGPIPIASIDVDRFYRSVEKTTDGCWLWRQRLSRGGYGTYRFYVDGRQRGIAAHRVSYTLSVGVIPDGLEIDHLCGVRHCVNPDHLEAVTPQENNARSSGVNAAKARQWLEGRCGNGHDLATVGIHKQGPGWTCAQCGRRSCGALQAKEDRTRLHERK